MNRNDMNWSKWIRQIHRWISIAFVVVVILVTIATATADDQEPAEWVYLSPLPLLALLGLTGLYLFVLPYVAKWRGGRGAEREG